MRRFREAVRDYRAILAVDPQDPAGASLLSADMSRLLAEAPSCPEPNKHGAIVAAHLTSIPAHIRPQSDS